MPTFWKNNQAPAISYYAVIFYSEKKTDLQGYAEMNEITLQKALAIDGCLGYSSVPGMFVSYWKDMDAINVWRNNSLHKQAKEQGIAKWYNYYHSLICKVEHAHEFFAENKID